jgi:hypothetical protein
MEAIVAPMTWSESPNEVRWYSVIVGGGGSVTSRYDVVVAEADRRSQGAHNDHFRRPAKWGPRARAVARVVKHRSPEPPHMVVSVARVAYTAFVSKPKRRQVSACVRRVRHLGTGRPQGLRRVVHYRLPTTQNPPRWIRAECASALDPGVFEVGSSARVLLCETGLEPLNLSCAPVEAVLARWSMAVIVMST